MDLKRGATFYNRELDGLYIGEVDDSLLYLVIDERYEEFLTRDLSVYSSTGYSEHLLATFLLPEHMVQ